MITAAWRIDEPAGHEVDDGDAVGDGAQQVLDRDPALDVARQHRQQRQHDDAHRGAEVAAVDADEQLERHGQRSGARATAASDSLAAPAARRPAAAGSASRRTPAAARSRRTARSGVRRISTAPITAPAIVGAHSSAASRRCVASSRRYAHAEANEPGLIASALVALATGDGMPQASAAGNDSSVPPPATAFTAPASAVAPNSRPSRSGCTAANLTALIAGGHSPGTMARRAHGRLSHETPRRRCARATAWRTIGACGGSSSLRRWCSDRTSRVRWTDAALPGDGRRRRAPGGARRAGARPAARPNRDRWRRRARRARAATGTGGGTAAPPTRSSSTTARCCSRPPWSTSRSAWRSRRRSSRAPPRSTARFPTTLEGEQAMAHDAALLFDWLLPQCAPLYPMITLAPADGTAAVAHAAGHELRPGRPLRLRAVHREAVLDPEAGRRRRHLRHGDGTGVAADHRGGPGVVLRRPTSRTSPTPGTCTWAAAAASGSSSPSLAIWVRADDGDDPGRDAHARRDRSRVTPLPAGIALTDHYEGQPRPALHPPHRPALAAAVSSRALRRFPALLIAPLISGTEQIISHGRCPNSIPGDSAAASWSSAG